MYAIQLPSGEFLDTPTDLQIPYELNNQVFSSASTDLLPGSYTFPFDLPLTGRLRRQLGWPDVITNARPWASIPECWIYVHNTPLFYGTLSVQQAGPAKVRVNIVSKPVGSLKDTPVSNVDLGGNRSLVPYASWMAYANTIAANPDNYDFLFTPVYNRDGNNMGLVSGDPSYAGSFFVNWYDESTESFVSDCAAISPFPKLSYVLQQIFAFASQEYQFTNEFQDGRELRRLYLFNNSDIRISQNGAAPIFPLAINLQNHVPEDTCAELVKKVMATFNLGLFTNIFQRTIRLIPLKKILARGPKWNWTKYCSTDYLIDQPENSPGSYNYSQPLPLPPDVPKPQNLTVFETEADFFAALPTLQPGFYYYEPNNVLFQIVDTGSTFTAKGWKSHHGIAFEPQGAQFDPGLDAMFQLQANVYMPETTFVASRHKEVDLPAGGTAWEWQPNKCGTSLLFYRGMWIDSAMNNVPIATMGVYYYTPTKIRIAITDDPLTDHGDAQYSLNWTGQYGLYNTWHAQWSEMIRSGKIVTRTFRLPLAELIRFNFEDKVTVENMDYLITRLRVQQALSGGYMLCEATMVSMM